MNHNNSETVIQDSLFEQHDQIDQQWGQWFNASVEVETFQRQLTQHLKTETTSNFDAMLPKRRHFPLIDDTLTRCLDQHYNTDYISTLYLALINAAYYNQGLSSPQVVAGGTLEEKNNHKWSAIHDSNFPTIKNTLFEGLTKSTIARCILLSAPNLTINQQRYQEVLIQQLERNAAIDIKHCHIDFNGIELPTNQWLNDYFLQGYTQATSQLKQKKITVIELIEDWRSTADSTHLNLLTAQKTAGAEEYWLLFNVSSHIFSWWQYKNKKLHYSNGTQTKIISLFHIWPDQEELQTPEFGIDKVLPNALFRRISKAFTKLNRPIDIQKKQSK